MTTVRTLSFAALTFAAVGCGPQQSTDSSSTAELTADKKSPTGAAGTLAGNYTVADTAACAGTFNTNDPTVIVANATTVTITQDVYPGDDGVFFTAAIGDVIDRPTADLIALGATLVDRQITAYSDNGNVVTFNEYQYDYHLTDEEGLATGLFRTITLSTDSSGVEYKATYAGSTEKEVCSFDRSK